MCRLLQWERNEVATNIGGYKFDMKTKIFPVFINYKKAEDISDSINYEDRFESSSQLIAISKQGRKVNSTDVVQIYNAEKDDVEMSLFVRKDKNDKISNDFYYLGKIKAVGTPKPIIMKKTNKAAVEIKYHLYAPMTSGCSSLVKIPLSELNKETPRAVIGLVDIWARPLFGSDIFAITVPYESYLKMEENSKDCFLQAKTWDGVKRRLE